MNFQINTKLEKGNFLEMSDFNKNYIKTASSAVELFYRRNMIYPGQPINSSYKLNKKLIKTLDNTTDLYVYLYMKPIGDSILFLSTIQAAIDYLKLTRRSNLPRIYAQSDLKPLLKHCNLFNAATYIDDVEKEFANVSNFRTSTMITDGDPFNYNKKTSFVFNTENYVYPKFIEGSREYKSRSARYYLTFEREVGIVLSTDPNLSMPTFEFPFSKKIEKSLKKKGLYLDESQTLISVITFVDPKERQKQFGVIRYLKVANKIQKSLQDKKVKFILFAHKSEEVKEWELAQKYIKENKHLDIFIYGDSNLEEIGYILARTSLSIGNDTGVSHLAAVSRQNMQSELNPTIIIYSRHDFGKWSTGKNNVFPIYTKLAAYLTKNNMSVGRDKLDTRVWDRQEFASSISISKVTNKAINLLKI